MRRFSFWFLLFFLLDHAVLCAQEDPDGYAAFRRQYEQEYDDFRRQRMEEYAAFRREANEQYAQWLGERWVVMKAEEGLTLPPQPKPPLPLVQKEGDLPPRDVALPYTAIEDPKEAPESIDVPDLILTPQQTEDEVVVDFYAQKLTLRLARGASALRLKSTTERDVRETWTKFSKGGYDALVQDCMTQKKRQHLCDWSYIQLCHGAALSVFGSNSTNDAVLLQAFLLTQSGYELRLAEADGRLSLLIPFDHTIYNYSYLTIDEKRYYVIDGRKKGQFRVVDHGFPQGSRSSILIARQPQLAMKATAARTFGGDGRYPEMQVTLGTNLNLIDFYSHYPLSDAWSNYARASLSESTKAKLYPALRTLIAGKSKQKATDMLLDFVQHAFDYKTDIEQFGHERPMFGDESFFYPYNDCEDRSILFVILVRELLGLDVVLLHYPGHLATAVDLGPSVQGDHVTLKGRRFTVCDPTYLGATLGESMPQFKGQNVKILLLDEIESK